MEEGQEVKQNQVKEEGEREGEEGGEKERAKWTVELVEGSQEIVCVAGALQISLGTILPPPHPLSPPSHTPHPHNHIRTQGAGRGGEMAALERGQSTGAKSDGEARD